MPAGRSTAVAENRSEARRLKKNAALREWRKRNREHVSEYMKQWRAEQRRKVAAAMKVLNEAAESQAPYTRETVRRTTIDIDEAKFVKVQQVLGTRTLRETVDRSFDEVLARTARAQSIERLQRMEGLDLDKPDVMAAAWR